jgi:hypothetical protein
VRCVLQHLAVQCAVSLVVTSETGSSIIYAGSGSRYG